MASVWGERPAVLKILSFGVAGFLAWLALKRYTGDSVSVAEGALFLGVFVAISAFAHVIAERQ